MAYHGYIPLMKKFISDLPHAPSVLEIGIDRGVTFIPIAAHLISNKENFRLIGLDVLLQQHVLMTLEGLTPVKDKQSISIVENSSLEVLPVFQKEGLKFDLILIDGDHNYHTVSKELNTLNDITYDHSIIVIDDYDGKWSEKDMWYSERPEYSGVKTATKRKKSKKCGVKIAVDEFVKSNPQWRMSKPIVGEPIVLGKFNILS